MAVHALYLSSVWLQILAATVWIGGMFFLVLVVVPWLRRGDRARCRALARDGMRFRTAGWACFTVLALTGGGAHATLGRATAPQRET